MKLSNHRKVSLYEEAKAGLSSLVKQTTLVFVGFLVMLLLTGGASSGFVVGLSFSLGVVFVAVSEKKRFEKPITMTQPRNLDFNQEVFEMGDFADFIKPIVDTLDLYHNHGVDPRAIAILFKRLAENYPEAELQIVAIEKRGQNKFLLRAKTAEDANLSELSAEYFSTYNQLAEKDKRILSLENIIELALKHLAEKDERILSLENIIELALKHPMFYAQTSQHQGDNIPENSGININAVGGVSAVRGDVSNQGIMNLGTISGNVTNAINQLPDSIQSEQPGIKELLTQLQTTIEAEVDLPQEDKAEALEQVKVLAEAGKNPQEGAMHKMGKTAMKILKGTVASLPNAAKLVKECNNLLPLISKLLDLG